MKVTHTVELLFDGKRISYDSFVQDLAERVAAALQTAGKKVVSQREAERLYGKANVRLWRDTGCVTVTRKKGKIEYPLDELKALSSMDQIMIDASKGKARRLQKTG